MKKSFMLASGALLLLLIFGTLFLVGFFGKQEIRNYPSSGKDIIAFGDSLVEGVGSSRSGGFVALLSQKLGREIINLGNGGDTTEDALARVDEIFRYDPKVVIILLGGNDFLRRIPKENTFRNLDTIVARVQEKGAIVLLVGAKGALFGDNAESHYAELAKRRGAAYIPNVLGGIFGHADFMHDSIHPNDKGYGMIAERVYPVLEGVI